MIVEIEGVEESVLAATLLTHDRDVFPSIGCHQHRPSDSSCHGVFQQIRSAALVRDHRMQPFCSEIVAVVGRHARATAVAIAEFLGGGGEGQVPR